MNVITNNYFETKNYFVKATAVGGIAIGWGVVAPTTIIGGIGITVVGFVGGLFAYIFSGEARSVISDLKYKKALKLPKVVSQDLFDAAFMRLQKHKYYKKFLEKYSYDHFSVKKVLRQATTEGSTHLGQMREIIISLGKNYSLSCKDVLAQLQMEDVFYRQMIHVISDPEDETFKGENFPKIINGKTCFDLFPVTARLSKYQNIIENAIQHAAFNQVIAGELRISNTSNHHVITWQLSDGMYRFYDSEEGFYAFDSQEDFYEELRAFLIDKYSETRLVQLIVYGIDKKPSEEIPILDEPSRLS